MTSYTKDSVSVKAMSEQPTRRNFFAWLAAPAVAAALAPSTAHAETADWRSALARLDRSRRAVSAALSRPHTTIDPEVCEMVAAERAIERLMGEAVVVIVGSRTFIRGDGVLREIDADRVRLVS